MIDILHNLGDDALSNLFDCILVPFPGAIDAVNTQFRIQNVSIPSVGVGTYETHYKTQRITKPNGKIEDPKEFSFDYRVDKNWNIYNGFKNWKNIVANTKTGIMTPDLPGSIRIPITVITTDSNGVPTGGKWIFEGTYIINQGEVGFDYTAGDPIMVTVTFGYLTLNDNF